MSNKTLVTKLRRGQRVWVRHPRKGLGWHKIKGIQKTADWVYIDLETRFGAVEIRKRPTSRLEIDR